MKVYEGYFYKTIKIHTNISAPSYEVAHDKMNLIMQTYTDDAYRIELGDLKESK